MSGEEHRASNDSAPDAELLDRHVAGDPDAFGELVRRHRDRLWSVAVRTLGNPHDAEDAVQDALVSALRAAASFRGDAAVTTWLHRIVVNACLDRMRRAAVRPQVPLDDARRPAPDPGPALQIAVDVGAALAALPAEQRMAVVLVHIEGYPVAEAAHLLAVPAGTVKSRCARGRVRLAVLLGHLAPGNPVAGAAVEPPTPVTGGEHP
ncbi:MAG: RNA polymerase sigma factor SigM [Mycobacteriales bacterium]